MHQLPINFEQPRTPEEVGLRDMLVDVVRVKAGSFRDDFDTWLHANFPIWREFERRALIIWRCGRKHFGQRMIWEAIRYETTLAERDGEFKLNDHYTTGVARLFVMMHPECEGLFEFRERREKVAA